MFKDFSIESLAEKINDSNSKNYFKEVHQTFVNGNYRSSVVMLYSVLICDLVYKLRSLKDIYADDKAIKILMEIEGLQLANPKSPEWENKLIEMIKTRMNFFQPIDIITIDNLQKIRHLSAHPVLNESDLLFSPNRETVQSFIRNILEGILTQPPYFSNRIVSVILEDLEDIKDTIINEDKIEHYLMSRYLKKTRDSEVKTIFRSIWKITLMGDVGREEDNREVNLIALKILLRKFGSLCLESLNSEPSFYSRIKNKNIDLLIFLTAQHPEIYKHLEESLKISIEEKTKTDDTLKFVAWFLSESLEKHFITLNPEDLSKIYYSAFELMFDISIANSLRKTFLDFCIRYFVSSNSFVDTENRLRTCITPYEEHWTLEQINAILEGANENYQIYNRIKAPQKLRDLASKFESMIDVKKYDKIYDA